MICRINLQFTIIAEIIPSYKRINKTTANPKRSFGGGGVIGTAQQIVYGNLIKVSKL